MVTLPSVCPLDCPDTCALDVDVEAGRVVAVRGAARSPWTAGMICAKVQRGLVGHVHGPDRVAAPLLRDGPKGAGRFREVSWDEALGRVAAGLADARDRLGGQSILPLNYGGSNGMLSDGAADARLFRRLGARRLLRTVCAAATGAATRGLYGAMPGMALGDFEHSRLIVLWGVNPSATGIHLVPVVRRAQRAGAKLIVVDPRRTPLAARADLHLAVRPGADLPLALALHRWLFEQGAADLAFLGAHARGVEELRAAAAPWTLEAAAAETGLSASDIEKFARMYAEISPAGLRCGWGQERSRCGGSATAAILALPAVAGKFGVRGGGFTLSNGGAWAFDPALGEPESPAPALNMNRVGRALLGEEGPAVAALFVYNANPLATLPDQERVRRGLLREDLFTVVFDPVFTDTAGLADVVLPATTFLERTELRRSYGDLAIAQAGPVIPPVGQARSNDDVFRALIARLGLARPGDPDGEDALAAAIVASHREGARLAAELAAADLATPPCGPAPLAFRDVFPGTPDRRVDLFPAALDAEAPAGLYGWQPDPATAELPLALISPATDRTISSTLGEQLSGPVAARLHPTDAGARGIADGDRVRLFNPLGVVETVAAIDPDLIPGVVSLPKGIWARHTHNGATSNALSPDSLTDLGGGACFNDARVQVERA